LTCGIELTSEDLPIPPQPFNIADFVKSFQ
jgi:hypothetical protein